jgi:tRNA-specific 2-thiouridylase
MYVSRIDAASNTVTLGTRADLLSSQLTASSLNFTKIVPPESPINVIARVRYRSKGVEASVVVSGEKAVVNFSEPVESVSPGQSVVFYDGDDLIGGGIID